LIYAVKVDFIEKEALLDRVAIATIEKRMHLSKNFSFIENLRLCF